MKTKNRILFSSIITVAFASGIAKAQTTWTKADNTTALTTSGSWTVAGVPATGDRLLFDSTLTTGKTASIGTGLDVLKITSSSTFDNGISANGSNTLSIGTEGISITGGGRLSFGAPVVLTGNQSWSMGTGRINVNNTLNTGGNTLAVSGSGTGSGILSFTGNNTLGTEITIGTMDRIYVQNGSTVDFNGTNNTNSRFQMFGGTANVASMGNLTTASSIGKDSAYVQSGATLNYTGNTFSSNKGMDRGNNGTSTIAVTTSGQTLSMSGNFTTAAVTGGWSLGGAGNLTLSGVISNGTNTTVTKTGAGTLTLSNAANTYAGVTTITDGVLSVSTIANGSANSSIGASTNAAANLVFNGGTLKYTGANVTSDRAFTINTGKTATIDTANNISFAGATGTTTNGALTKTGAGTLTLTGLNTYTGATTINGGTLLADLSTNTTGVINSSSALTLGGGKLNVQGNSTGSSSQTLGNLTLNGGLNTISLNPNGGTGTTLNLGDTWTKNAGGTLFIDLSSASSGTRTLTSNPTLNNDILGYAVVKDATGTGFATTSSGNVVRYTAATVITGNLATNTVSTTNYSTGVGAGLTGAATTQTLNSLEYTTGNNLSSAAKTLVIGSGGLLATSTSLITTDNDITFTSGNGELNIYSANTTGFDFRIGGAVTNNGVTSVSVVKSGPGTLMMNGTNSYSGDTVINEGALKATSIPSGAGKGNFVLNSGGSYILGVSTGGTRTINGLSNTTQTGGTINNTSYSAVQANTFLDLGNNDATASFNGVISFGSIIKSGTGTQTFGGVNTYEGSTAVNAGKLTIASTGTINSTSGVSIGAGEFNYNSSTALSKTASFTGTGGTLSGTGTITPAVTVNSNNTYTPGAKGAAGTQTLTGGVTFSSGSIFQWDIGISGASETGHDTVTNTGGLAGSGAIFNVVLGTGAYTDTFWDTAKTWNDVFSVGNLASIFSSITGTGVVWDSGASRGNVAGEGYFTMATNTLSWTAVPEPTGALAGLLITVGLLRRRRTE